MKSLLIQVMMKLSKVTMTYDLFLPTSTSVMKLVNHISTMTKSRAMFRSQKYLKAKVIMTNGYRFYINSASVKNVSYRIEITWSNEYNADWENTITYSCTCPFDGICKHIGVSLLHLSQR